MVNLHHRQIGVPHSSAFCAEGWEARTPIPNYPYLSTDSSIPASADLTRQFHGHFYPSDEQNQPKTLFVRACPERSRGDPARSISN
jgi:hypothetical protein